MGKLNYEKDMWIDDTALDVECLHQPQLMMRYSRALADAKREVTRLKEQLDIVRAELDKKVRTDPDKYGLDKITESVVTNTIMLDTQYQAAVDDLRDAQYEVNMLIGAVDSVQQRKDMLEALIKLHGQQYFAGPKMPRDLSFEARQRYRQREADNKVIVKRRK